MTILPYVIGTNLIVACPFGHLRLTSVAEMVGALFRIVETGDDCCFWHPIRIDNPSISAMVFISCAERLRSPSAHLVRRRCGTPCWLRLSSAVPGFALQIVSAWFVTFVIQWWRVHCACGCQYIPCQRLRSPSRHLWRVVVERLVGSHFHWLFLASLSEIVLAWFVTFVSQWWRVRCARGSSLFPDPTSGFRLRRALAPIVWNPLFGYSFSIMPRASK